MNFAEIELPQNDTYSLTRGKFLLDVKGLGLDTDMMKGTASFSRTISDLLFHFNDTCEQQSSQFSQILEPGVTLGVLLRGTIQFSLEDKAFEVEASSPRCFAFNLATPTKWTRKTIENNHVTKILITIPHHWITQKYKADGDMGSILNHLMRSHKELWQCEASHKTHQLCRNTLNELNDELSDLEIESLALNFISSLLKDTSPLLAQDSQINRGAISQSAFKIFQYLENNVVSSNPPVQPDLKAIAQQLGLSISSAQRSFKQGYHQTIIEFVRNRRLEIAREQLLKDMSIGEVAYLAGYRHSSNFALAFKKMFGVPPGEIGKLT